MRCGTSTTTRPTAGRPVPGVRASLLRDVLPRGRSRGPPRGHRREFGEHARRPRAAQQLAGIFATRTQADWVRFFSRPTSPVGPCTGRRAARRPAVRRARSWSSFRPPEAGPILAVAPPIRPARAATAVPVQRRARRAHRCRARRACSATTRHASRPCGHGERHPDVAASGGGPDVDHRLRGGDGREQGQRVRVHRVGYFLGEPPRVASQGARADSRGSPPRTTGRTARRSPTPRRDDGRRRGCARIGSSDVPVIGDTPCQAREHDAVRGRAHGRVHRGGGRIRPSPLAEHERAALRFAPSRSARISAVQCTTGAPTGASGHRERTRSSGTGRGRGPRPGGAPLAPTTPSCTSTVTSATPPAQRAGQVERVEAASGVHVSRRDQNDCSASAAARCSATATSGPRLRSPSRQCRGGRRPGGAGLVGIGIGGAEDHQARHGHSLTAPPSRCRCHGRPIAGRGCTRLSFSLMAVTSADRVGFGNAEGGEQRSGVGGRRRRHRCPERLTVAGGLPDLREVVPSKLGSTMVRSTSVTQLRTGARQS